MLACEFEVIDPCIFSAVTRVLAKYQSVSWKL